MGQLRSSAIILLGGNAKRWGGAMDDQGVAHLAELAEQYRGKDPQEQEYLLAMALARTREDRIPDLGAKDFWKRARDNLVRSMVAQKITVGTITVDSATNVVHWATTQNLDLGRLELVLAILTAMVADAVLNAMDGGRRGGDDDDRRDT